MIWWAKLCSSVEAEEVKAVTKLGQQWLSEWDLFLPKSLQGSSPPLPLPRNHAHTDFWVHLIDAAFLLYIAVYYFSVPFPG